MDLFHKVPSRRFSADPPGATGDATGLKSRLNWGKTFLQDATTCLPRVDGMPSFDSLYTSSVQILDRL